MEISQEFDTLRILAEMDRNLSILARRHERGLCCVDLSVVADWVTPIHLIALSALSRYYGMNIECVSDKRRVCSYLDRISFPDGTDKIRGSSGTTLPLTRLSCETGDDVLGRYEDRILRGVDPSLRSSFRNSLKYLTSELVTNVREHSRDEFYWLLAQYWPSTSTCEIAIADNGVGYLESYRGTRYEAGTHHEAIQNALDGNSSKGWVERGAGIPGTVRIFTEGYEGEVVFMTGDALRYIKGGESQQYRLNSFWPGALVGLRFNVSYVNIHPFLAGD